MITPEVKEAWRFIKASYEATCNWGNKPLAECQREYVMARAYIEAEWCRRQAEFKTEHYATDEYMGCSECGVTYYDGKYGQPEKLDKHHTFTNEQWRQEVIAELEG